jgi:hypothetical protein
MKTQNNCQRTSQGFRGQRGSSEVRHVCPVIDLNWKKISERWNDVGCYFPKERLNEIPSVISEPRALGCGAVFGYQVEIRGSPEYRY